MSRDYRTTVVNSYNPHSTQLSPKSPSPVPLSFVLRSTVPTYVPGSLSDPGRAPEGSGGSGLCSSRPPTHYTRMHPNCQLMRPVSYAMLQLDSSRYITTQCVMNCGFCCLQWQGKQLPCQPQKGKPTPAAFVPASSDSLARVVHVTVPGIRGA